MLIKWRKLSDYKIKKCVKYFCTDIDATKSSAILGLNGNAINRYYGIFRWIIYQKQVSDKQLFFGEIELDGAYFGSKQLRRINMPKKRGRGTWKQPVFGVFERNTRVHTEIVPNAKQDALRTASQRKLIIENAIEISITLMSYQHYNRISILLLFLMKLKIFYPRTKTINLFLLNKTELRKIYLQKRRNLRQEEVRINSLNLLSQMKETTIFQKKIFHIFIPIEQKKEIFTWFIINFLWAKGKTVVVSKSNFEDKTMKHFILKKETSLRKNKYGIPEPVSAQSINLNRIEVVFVPMLISDEQNNRVGYGKGFYDRFLMKCSEDVLRIGLNFFSPIKQITDISSLDIPLQKVFTNSLK